MSFLRKIFGGEKAKTKKYRSESTLKLQRGLDKKTEIGLMDKPTIKDKDIISFEEQTKILEEKLNKPETRSTPPTHINVIRKLAQNYIELGKKEFNYYKKAENLYKQFNVLYPLHMEKIDWIKWIQASTKAKMIREARKLLQEARLLFPGDIELDKIETDVLHISTSQAS